MEAKDAIAVSFALKSSLEDTPFTRLVKDANKWLCRKEPKISFKEYQNAQKA